VAFLLFFKDRGTPAVTAGQGSELTTLEAPGAPLPTPKDTSVDR
jgi:hypothetical protein